MKLNGWAGHSLVEVLAAVGLFAISIVALLGLVASTQGLAQRADHAYSAFNLAKNRLEFLRTVTFDDLDVAEEDEVRVDANGVPDNEGRFLRSTTVTTPYEGDAALAHVDVEVVYEVKGAVSGAAVELSSVIRNEDA